MIEWLPHTNAFFNFLATICLWMGWRAIKADNRQGHRTWMLSALTCSGLFLAGYLTRMAFSGSHRFPDLGWIRTVYLLILGSHIILAALMVPFILAAVVFAFRGNFGRHTQITRWLWPIWMYVSVTGIVVYAMIYHVAPMARS